MRYDKIIETEENKERWCVDYENKTITRQEFRKDYQYLNSNPYWHDDVTIKIENLKKVIDNL